MAAPTKTVLNSLLLTSPSMYNLPAPLNSARLPQRQRASMTVSLCLRLRLALVLKNSICLRLRLPLVLDNSSSNSRRRTARYHPKAKLIWSDEPQPTLAMQQRLNLAAKMRKARRQTTG